MEPLSWLAGVVLSTVAVLPRDHVECRSGDSSSEIIVRVMSAKRIPPVLATTSWWVKDGEEAGHDVFSRYAIGSDGAVSIKRMDRNRRGKPSPLVIWFMDSELDDAKGWPRIVVGAPACVLVFPETA